MYAIIVDGQQQLKVSEGQELNIAYRGSATRGEMLTFDRVLAYHDGTSTKIGAPALAGASVEVEVLDDPQESPTQGPKLVVQKFRRRKNSRRKTGHRQVHTRVRVSKITGV